MQKRHAHTDDTLFTSSSGGGGGKNNDNSDKKRVAARAVATTSSTTDDIDANDNESIECLVEYVNDTFRNLKQEEQRHRTALRPLRDAGQTDLTGKMRALAIDWIFDVRLKFRMRSETLFLAVSLLDRYLSVGGAAEAPIARTDLQECICAAMVLAATLEESYPVESRDYVLISANCFTAQALKTRSWRIAAALQFDLWSPNALHFLRRYSKASKNDTKQHTLAKYYCQSALLNYHSLIVCYLPSQIAAASILLARLAHLDKDTSTTATTTASSTTTTASSTTTARATTTTTAPNQGARSAISDTNSTPKKKNAKPWSHTLNHYTGYSIDDIAECTAKLWFWMHYLNQSAHTAAYREYDTPTLFYTSKLALPTRETMRQCLLDHLPADSVIAIMIADSRVDIVANAKALFSFL